jgi:acyl-CoA synthetase (AMP-forming)/AMP-acid ligase II
LLRPTIFAGLRALGDRPAIVTPVTTLSYGQLAALVDAARRRLGPTRRLIALAGHNDVSALTWLIAALTDRHVVILSSPQALDSLVEAYDPDVVIDGDVTVDRPGTRHDLHDDLALLLSTSGSTGSAKTVRISHSNLIANAEAIAEYLRLTPDDRALTTLPMHYCYGLSVITSHLQSGASLALTELSVADACLWDFARAAEITSFPGVPYTFEMLTPARLAESAPDSLRFITQAGGRMPPEAVREWAEYGASAGVDFVVMYGQTEATARMAYLPAHLARTHPHALGIAIPGGWLRLDPVAGRADVGELVYRGENVMLGYASGPHDLWRGPELTELRTGDLATVEDGLFVWKGRRTRVAKCFGLRIDLDHVEAMVAESGLTTRCVPADSGVHAFVERSIDVARARELVEHHTRLPLHAIDASALATVPRTAAGKVDYHALSEQASAIARTQQTARHTTAGSPEASVRDVFATLLGRPDASDGDSFVSLGGDSLSYAEISVLLADRGIDLQSGWQHLTIGELQAAPRDATRMTVRTDTSVALRALAIVLIVGTHSNVFTVPGGAHLLLAIAGYNFARFSIGGDRLRHGLTAVARVAVPSSLWIGGIALVTGAYQWTTALMLNGLLGQDRWTTQWQFWFLEAWVWIELVVVLLTATPWLAHWLRRSPFPTVAGATVVALAIRFAWVGVEAGPTERYTPGVVAWVFCVGWAAAIAHTRLQRVIVGALATVGMIGFFGDLQREATVIAGIVLLMLWPTVRLPRVVVRLAGALASASLFIYLTHWQVYPHLEDQHPTLGLLASLVVGYAAWCGWEWLLSGWRGARARDRARTRRLRRRRVVPAWMAPAPQAASRPAG